MRYRFLLKFLQGLIYIKRFFWWTGTGVFFVLGKIAGFFTRGYLHVKLSTMLALRRIGITQGSQWLYKRDVVQVLVFLILFGTTLNQTKLVTKLDLSFVGQKTLAYSLVGGEEDLQTEEIVIENKSNVDSYSWKTGTINISEGQAGMPGQGEQDIGAVVAGGSALSKPNIIPGATVAVTNRNQVTDYVVEAGNSIGSIANDFGVSVVTILWENNLTARSIIRPGDTLKIPPTSGVMHTIKKGDTLQKIAKLYRAETPVIIAFNSLKEDGTDIKVGQRIMIPDGIRPQSAVVTVTRPGKTVTTLSRLAAPPNSYASPGSSGFVWPSAAHIITQYYGFTHHALDIAGPWQSSIYAAKAGTVVTSQCGWNSGYGCYVIINHGNGVKTLYGHNSQLLVSPGEEVETGQTIALMGNTGHVRGVTGIHLHFEVQVNGVRVNPLGYVR
jgi:LysM repeat protein